MMLIIVSFFGGFSKNRKVRHFFAEQKTTKMKEELIACVRIPRFSSILVLYEKKN